MLINHSYPIPKEALVGFNLDSLLVINLGRVGFYSDFYSVFFVFDFPIDLFIPILGFYFGTTLP